MINSYFSGIDPRIMSVEKLDRAKTVLVDAGSLSTLAHVLIEPTIPTLDISLLTERGGPTLANIIQNIVLYDTITVDSLLFEIYSDVSTACELFPNIIRGIYLRRGVREKIGDIVNEIAHINVGPPREISRDDWTKWQWQESKHIQLMQNFHSVVPTLIPPEYANDWQERFPFEMERPFTADIPLCCLGSMMTLGRAHFYLELARELGVPLSANPDFSNYFEVLLTKFKGSLLKGKPEEIVAFFEAQVSKAAIDESKGLISLDLSIPPVAELVVNYAKQRRCSLHTATLEVRESKNAVEFREWCAKLASLKGRSSFGEQQEMVGKLKDICETWKRSVREEVKYKTRKLAIEAIPYLGGILKAIGVHEVKLKGPVSMPREPYFLFLNDLLRPPKHSAPLVFER